MHWVVTLVAVPAPSLVHRGEALGGEQQKVGEEEKINCWNWGELPCDNLFGNRKHGSESKPSRVWRRRVQPCLWCKWQQPGLERSLKWCCFPLFFMSLPFLHKVYCIPQGQQLPRAMAGAQLSCTEKGILLFFVMQKMTFRYLDPHESHLILHAC